MVRGSILLAALFAVSFLAGSAQACNRCGHRVCRFVKHVPVQKVIERVVTPVDQSDRSITVVYKINQVAPPAREGTTSFRDYSQDYYDPSGIVFNFDEYSQRRDAYGAFLGELAEKSDQRHAQVVQSIARIKGYELDKVNERLRLQIADKLLSGDKDTLEFLLNIKSGHDGPGDEPSRDPEQPEVSDIPPMVTASCVRCHSGDAPRGGLDFSDPSVVSVQAEKMLEAVMKDKMPLDDEQKPVPLSPLDKLAFGNQLFAKE